MKRKNNTYDVKMMDIKSAKKIITWKYDDPYEAYSFNGTEEEKLELLNGLNFAVYLKATGELAGFCTMGPSAQAQNEGLDEIYDEEGYNDVAFGLKPELTDKGLGNIFVKECCEFLRKFFPGDMLRLTVASNNERALKVYRANGFYELNRFESPEINGAELVVMVCGEYN